MAEENLNSSTAATNLEFVLHVIPPPRALDWSSPRSLLRTSFINHALKDPAPIGHLFVEFPFPENARTPDSSWVITGMTRKKMSVLGSLKIVQGKKLGLGTFYHDFAGKLDSVEEAREELAFLGKKERTASIRVSISENQTQLMMGFLQKWIEHGSFHHYSGGLRVELGEGGGCAEFGMHFLSMALGLTAIHPEWIRSVRVPHDLIGGGFRGHHRSVGILKLFKKGGRWASQSEAHEVYAIPDPELIFNWIKKREPQSLSVSLSPESVAWHSGQFTPREFHVSYPLESAQSIQEQWARVTEKKGIR